MHKSQRKVTKPLIAIVFFGIWISLLTPWTAVAQETKSYQGTMTALVVENDIAFAKNNAFQSLQKLLLYKAIEDLIGIDLLNEVRASLAKNRELTVSAFIVSAKITNEYSENNTYTLEMTGRINTEALSKVLRKMNLGFTDDPDFPVTFLIEDSIRYSEEMIRQRLKLFHVGISTFKSISTSSVPWQERTKFEFIESLFLKYPHNQIIYFVDSIPDLDSENFKQIRTQIFRKSDFSVLSSFRLNLSAALSPDEFAEKHALTIDRYLSQFEVGTIKLEAYNTGLESALNLKVEGLTVPFVRTVFEDEFLKGNRAIKSYFLSSISTDVVTYRIQTKSGPEALIDSIKSITPHFYFVIDQIDIQTIRLEAFHRLTESVKEMAIWTPEESVLQMIRELYQEDDLVLDDNILEEPGDKVEIELSEDQIPKLIEQEPNNYSQTVNRLPESTLVLGRTSSRADEDIFQLQRKVESTTIAIEWQLIGKTTLSPQLRLYDENFNFINSYDLIGSQRRLHFQYNFHQSPPEKIYLRITDKVGFIQGETGGFKSFHYLLKYHWIVEESPGPSEELPTTEVDDPILTESE